MDYKLNFELVPDGCWYINLRSVLSKSQWEYIKKLVKQDCNGKCSICGKPTRYIDAHEKWEYDEKSKTQKLVGIIGVCKDCHSVIHIGRTQLLGNERKAEEHFMKVNDCSFADYRAELGKANERHKRLNEVSEWALDVSYILEFIKMHE